MKKAKDIFKKWQSAAETQLTAREYMLRLPISDAARIEALNEIYPEVSLEEIITDLISLSLDEMETSMPYVPGDRIIAEDDYGDPIYEDVGPSARFREATKKYTDTLRAAMNQK